MNSIALTTLHVVTIQNVLYIVFIVKYKNLFLIKLFYEK